MAANYTVFFFDFFLTVIAHVTDFSNQIIVRLCKSQTSDQTLEHLRETSTKVSLHRVSPWLSLRTFFVAQ